MTTQSKSDIAGFTLVELILVLIVVGILSIFVAPRFFNRTTFDARTFADDTQSLLRYAQKVAIAQNRIVYVSFANNRSALCFDSACSLRVLAPANRPNTNACSNDVTWMCAAFPSGVNVVAPTLTNQSFFFNQLGRPFNSNDTGQNSTFAKSILTLSGGGVTRAITIERETGYVHQ